MGPRETDEQTSNHREWRRGERSKVSVMHIFRSAHADHDARVARAKSADGESEVSARSKQRRQGMDEASLKNHLQADLNALMNTVRLDAAIPLDDTPHVQRSVVNYGFRDLSSVTSNELGTPQIVNSIRQSLLDHEPRLIPESLDIKVSEDKDSIWQRLTISISAELTGDPVDIPVDFDAEVDLGAGKLRMSNLRIQG